MNRILKKWMMKNWAAKIASLLLAIALWFLINQLHENERGRSSEEDSAPTGSTFKPTGKEVL